MFESLSRLLILKFIESSENGEALKDVMSNCSEALNCQIQTLSDESLSHFMNDAQVASVIEKYLEFCDNVRNGCFGKTGKFWMSYLDHVAMILKLTRAVKTNDFELYAYCMTEMADIFFSFGGHNYARYLSYFSMFIVNIEFNHPGALDDIKLGVISVARSFIPGNRCAVDKTIEETFMKHAKSKGGAGGGSTGICGLTKNLGAYQRWIRSMHERCKYLNATHTLADMNDESLSSRKHKDLRPAEIRKNSNQVEATIDAITSFVNPFSIEDTNSLYCLSSGVKTPTEIEKDILTAEQIGKAQRVSFIEERLEGNASFFNPIKKANLKTMANVCKKASVKGKQNKVIELKQTGNIAFQLLVKAQTTNRNVDLEEVMKHQLTPVPSCFGSADGFLGKTNKAKGMQHVTKGVKDSTLPNTSETLVIVDGNAVFHSLSDIPQNFRDIALSIFNMVPKGGDTVFSTDMYQENSIKAQERKRRGISEKFLVKGPNVKKNLLIGKTSWPMMRIKKH